jgi:hypothetical protein
MVVMDQTVKMRIGAKNTVEMQDIKTVFVVNLPTIEIVFVWDQTIQDQDLNFFFLNF